VIILGGGEIGQCHRHWMVSVTASVWGERKDDDWMVLALKEKHEALSKFIANNFTVIIMYKEVRCKIYS
jgi:hypothetical protein